MRKVPESLVWKVKLKLIFKHELRGEEMGLSLTALYLTVLDFILFQFNEPFELPCPLLFQDAHIPE